MGSARGVGRVPGWARRRPVIAALWAAQLATAAAYAAVRTFAASAVDVTVLTDVVMAVLGLCAASMAWASARANGGQRLGHAWALMAAALTVYFLGDLAWAAEEIGSGSPPDASVADVFYLAFYPLAMASLVAWRGGLAARRDRMALVLDAATIATASLMVQWVAVVAPQLDGVALDPVGVALAVGYPVGDALLLLGLAAALLYRPFRDVDRALVAVAVALSANLAGDLVSGSAWLNQAYETGGLCDLLFMVFWLGAGAGCVLGSVARAPRDETGVRRVVARAPLGAFAATGVGLAVLILVESADGATGAVMGAGAAILALLAGARVYLGAREASDLAVAAGLREAEARFAAILEASNDAVLVLDAGGRVLYATSSVLAVLGHPAGRLVGVPAADLARPEEGPRLDEFIARARGGDVGGVCSWHPAAAAGEVVLESSIRNRLDDPLVGGLVLTTRDVTARTRLEGELEAARRVEALGRLAGGVAHQFNNLLTAIAGNAELLRTSLVARGEDLGDVDQILDGTGRAARLTAQLLAVGQRQLIRPSSLDLASEVAGLRSLLEDVAGPGVRLELALPPGLPRVRLDRRQLGDVLVLLAGQARDAGAGGVLRISAEAETDAADCGAPPAASAGPHVLLVVWDSAQLIDTARLKRLFDPFGDSLESGPGLDLPSVYGSIRQIGGWVDAASGPGAGTKFRIHLPLA